MDRVIKSAIVILVFVIEPSKSLFISETVTKTLEKDKANVNFTFMLDM